MAIPNQAPDSSVSGVLQPTEPQPAYQLPPGDTMADYLQQYIAAIAGMDGHMVYQRWQAEPPNLPAFGVDWAAAGVIRRRQIGIYGATIRHAYGNNGDGYDEMQRHEEFDLFCSFYGANAQYYCDNLIDNLKIGHNKAFLKLVGMAYVEVTEPLLAPELIRERWWNRYDATVVMRRIIRRNYNVLNLLEAFAELRTSNGFTVPIDTLEITPYAP